MAHWAELDNNNKVLRITVGDNNDPNGDEGYQWLIDNLGGTWIKASYNTYGNVHNLGGTPLHKNYPSIGDTWDGVGFYSPNPYPSWSLDSDTYLWKPPVPRPAGEDNWVWVEADLNWQII
jgi:hypothetical protein